MSIFIGPFFTNRIKPTLFRRGSKNFSKDVEKFRIQAGAELCQAQFKRGWLAILLGFGWDILKGFFLLRDFLRQTVFHINFL
jgi:hypothetical protein